MIPLAVSILLLAARAGPDTVDIPGIGVAAVHAPAGRPSGVVLLLSGPDARAATADLGAGLAARGALVVGLDAHAYLSSRPAGRCAYPAGDLETVAQHVEKVRGLEGYLRPLLVGHGPGAAVAWAALAQGPAGTFAGAVLAAPCPAAPLPVRLCAGSGPAPRVLPGGALPVTAPAPAPVEVIAGADDRACPPREAAAFAAGLAARYTEVPGAAGTLTAPLAAAIDGAVTRHLESAPPAAQPAPVSIADLPVVEVPARAKGKRLAILLTGDGGWVGLDKKVGAALADAGVAVVGLDSLRYLWKRRSPDEMARDVGRIAAHYGAEWGRTELLLIGYSRGADLAPFVAQRLPPEERQRLRLVALLGPSTYAEFEVHAVDIFASLRRRGALPTEPAVRATAGAYRMVCVHGSDEHDSLCPRLAGLPWVKDVSLEGGHHFDGDYAALARIVLDAADRR